MDSSNPTRQALEAIGKPPLIPNRFREAVYHSTDDAMPPAFAGALGQWLHSNRDRFVRGGDDRGLARYNHELINVDECAPNDLLAPFKKMLIAEASKPEVLDALCVPAFDLRFVETHATCYHHGSHFNWHDDAASATDSLVESRRITFCYYLHSEPKMFEGGGLEFLDGTVVEPKNNRLTLFHPIQQHRVNRVECWSSHFLHGRWALMGWLHGDAPEGWVDRIPKLRGAPSGAY